MSRAYLLTTNTKTGQPVIEIHRSKSVLSDNYRGHPDGRGIVISTKAEYDTAASRVAGNGWAEDLLTEINRETLED